jgi:hypothetical protein
MTDTSTITSRTYKLGVLGFDGVALLQPDGVLRGDRDELSWSILRGDAFVASTDLRPRVVRIGAAPAWQLRLRQGDGDVVVTYTSQNIDDNPVLLIDIENQSTAPIALRWRGMGDVMSTDATSEGCTSGGRRWLCSARLDSNAEMAVLHGRSARIAMVMTVGLKVPQRALTIDLDTAHRGWEKLLDQCAQLEHPDSAHVAAWRAMLGDVAIFGAVPPRQLPLERVLRELQLSAQLGIFEVIEPYIDDVVARQLLDGSWLPDGAQSDQSQVATTATTLSAIALAYRALSTGRSDDRIRRIGGAITNAATWLERNAVTRGRWTRKVSAVPAAVSTALADAADALVGSSIDGSHQQLGQQLSELVAEWRDLTTIDTKVGDSSSPIDGWVLADVAHRTLTLFPDPGRVGNANVRVGRLVTSLGTVDTAVRWHEGRPALLWEIIGATQPILLRTGLAPTWSRQLTDPATDFRGETLIS